MSFKEYLAEAKMPPALKKKIEDIKSGKMDSDLKDIEAKAKKFDNKQILKAVSDRRVARVEGKSGKKLNDWAKKFIKTAQEMPELSDPWDIAQSAGIDYEEYEKNSREIDKEIKKLTRSRNLADFVKSVG